MSQHINVVAIPLKPDREQSEQTVPAVGIQIREPGTIRRLAWIPKATGLVDGQGRERMEEVLTAFVECRANGPLRNRTFRLLPTATAIKVYDGHRLEFVETAVSPHTNRVVHVYEVLQESLDGKSIGRRPRSTPPPLPAVPPASTDPEAT